MKVALDRPDRLLLVAAHPDDETLGAAAMLARARAVRVLYLTDGAPRNKCFRSVDSMSRESYATLRRREALSALRMVGLRQPDIVTCNVADQEAALHLAELADALRLTIQAWQPNLIVTHAYEGSHPDHDAAAFTAHAAVELLSKTRQLRPQIIEMALYHGFGGGYSICRFLPTKHARSEITNLLTPWERARKRAMLRCFKSQKEVCRPFYDLPFERYRMALTYDFSQAPHAGALLYERWGMAMTGSEWRRRAELARTELGL